ncbi:MAG: AAA family ATPase [Candidatus Nitrosocaldus sp.]
MEASRTVSEGDLQLDIEGLGPIVKGSVKIKPLTVFIGPNGSGKSYTAMFLYALYNGFIKKYFDLAWVNRHIYDFSRKDIRSLRNKRNYYSFISSRLKSLKKDAYEGLTTVFSDINNLVNVNSNSMKVSISTKDIKYSISLKKGKKGEVSIEMPDKNSLISLLEEKDKSWKIIRRGRYPKEYKVIELEAMSKSMFVLRRRFYYMPASRSGLIHAHRIVASAIVTAAPKLPFQEMPKLTGVVADFIATLISIPDMIRYKGDIDNENEKESKEFRKNIKKVIKFLDDYILKGNIYVSDMKEFMYKSSDPELNIPVVNAASGIAELAPLSLYLKYIIEPDDLLILEEPESHLHPELQRKVARLLAMLARAGVRVLITTHSDYLLHQINTLLLLSKLSGEDRKKFGYMENEFLNPNDVGAYLFKYDEEKKGYIIEELPTIDEESNEPGIPEDALTEVAFAMGKEVSKITYMLEERSNDG